MQIMKNSDSKSGQSICLNHVPGVLSGQHQMADGVEFAGCYITGSEVWLDTDEADERRMPDCPIKCKRGRERRKKVYRKNKRMNRQEE